MKTKKSQRYRLIWLLLPVWLLTGAFQLKAQNDCSWWISEGNTVAEMKIVDVNSTIELKFPVAENCSKFRIWWGDLYAVYYPGGVKTSEKLFGFGVSTNWKTLSYIENSSNYVQSYSISDVTDGVVWLTANINLRGLDNDIFYFTLEGAYNNTFIEGLNKSFTWTYEVGPVRKGNPLHEPEIMNHTFRNDGKVDVGVSIPNFSARDDIGTSGDNAQNQLYVKPPAQSAKKYDIKQGTNVFPAGFTGSDILNFTLPRTKVQLNNGETIDAEATRSDRYFVGVNPVTKWSPTYLIPSYPQPLGLTVSIISATRKIKLEWNMTQGSAQSPTDGYSFRWRKSGGSWADIPGVSKSYVSSETRCSVEFDYPEYNQGKNNYEFRVKRANMAWDALDSENQLFEASKLAEINTDNAKVESVIANGNENGILVNWTLSEGGTINKAWKYRITRDNTTVLSSSIDIDSLSYFDNTVPSCTPSTYKIEMLNDVGVVLSELSSSAAIRPNLNPGQITSLSVSKGFYNDRVVITWNVSSGAGFSRYTVVRKQLNIANAPEQTLYQVQSTGIQQYSYEDKNAIPGIYYIYTVKADVDCGGTQSKAVEVSSTGFMQPFGVVSGRISYTGSLAVKDVSVTATGETGFKNKSMTLTDSLYIRTPYKDNSFASDRFTFQAWYKYLQKESSNDWQCLFYSMGRYWIAISNDNSTYGYNNNLVLRHFNSNGGPYDNNSNYTEIKFDSISFPQNEYHHISITSSVSGGTITAKLYMDGKWIQTVTETFNGTAGSPSVSANPYTYVGLLSETGAYRDYCHGYMDELRIWKKALTEEEIMNNYDRYLSGQEQDLALYYRFDEEAGDEVFDLSGYNGIFNENHGTVSGNFSNIRSEYEIPDSNQLSIKTLTDQNGYYILNTIPYTGNGNTFNITPVLGVHHFDPLIRPLFFSPSSSTHNNVDFTDISAFEVTGQVVYEGGTYPVADCTFEIDDRSVTLTNGELVKTDAYGMFTISVPIGVHKVRIVKQGHSFANNGYMIDEITGENLTYNAPLIYNFFDRTRVKLIGRVVGGAIENDKPLGFGESNNNIGAGAFTLETTRPQYNFTNSPNSTTFYHNQGQWLKPGGLTEDSTKVTYEQDKITVTVSPATGEFVAMVYPELYTIGEIRAPGENSTSLTVYNKYETINLTPSAVPDSSYLKTSIRTWMDSTFVTNRPGVVDHWEFFEQSDTVRYNDKWTYYYQATPTFSLKQVVNGQVVDYLGEKNYIIKDELTNVSDTLELYNETTHDYLFDDPVFCQGTQYIFRMNAYEEYTNYVSSPAKTVQYPVKEGQVNMTNNIRLSPEPETIDMDENGEADYIFMAGAPNLTTGTNNFFATITVGNISYNWDLGTAPLVAWHLGDKSTGTDFMTAGPDQITAILRDPPGSKSKSFIEEGTVISSKSSYSKGLGVNAVLNLTTHLGAKITTFVGLGAGIITETEVINDAGLGLKTETKMTEAMETEKKTTFTERIETSDDPLYVGHYGDVFIGNSTNLLYGLTNAIKIQKNYQNEFDVGGNDFITKGDYSIAPAISLAFGQTFDTRFAFTQMEIEEIMIPKWKDNLATLLNPVNTPVNLAIITNPVYVSNLPHDDENFGKLNTDPIFGASASTPDKFHDGPSYTIHFPVTYDMADFKVDSVMYFNNQIEGWIAALARNEQEKVEMTRIGNYSFGSGANIQYSKTTSTTNNYTYTLHAVINPTIGLKVGGEVAGIGLEFEVNEEIVNEIDEVYGNSKETTVTSGFILQEEGDDDEITVDYGMTKSGTYAFKTLGGRTSCPYEDKLVTQYYQPGQHILSEATMQIEVPKISVSSAPQMINVPANRTASFTLDLQNETETGEDVWFELIVDEITNPNGAELKIDGGIIGNGRIFLVKAGETLQKTLTVGRGTVDTYENIALILRSQCQNDPTEFWPLIADTTFISVEFIPSCSDIAITEPRNNWILNADSRTGDTLYVSLANYDVNFTGFGYIRLEYRPTSSPNWNTVTTFYPSALYPDAQGVKEDIGTRATIVYPWKMPEADGAYELRATTATVNISGNTIVGNPLSTYSTDAVTGYKDVHRPVSLGAPSPANGIFGAGDELSITFNEDIQTGLLTQNNFSISGVLNAQTIAEPNVGLSFEGTQSAITEFPVFANGSFSIETWFKRNPNTAGTLFAFGANDNYLSLGFNASGNAVLNIGSESYTSAIAVANDETWKYIALSYDRDLNAVSVFEFEGATNNILFNNRVITAFPSTEGKLIVGNNAANSDGFRGAVSQLHFYGVSRTQGVVTANMNLTKSGREYGLIGYWALDEGEGAVAKDLARSRNLLLNTGWYVYPSGYAKETDNTCLSIPTGTYYLDSFSDLTLEFWFRSKTANQVNQTLFSADNGSIGTNTNGELTLYKNDGTVNQVLTTDKLTDTRWHHIALLVRRGGNVNLYIDGINKATFAETLLGSFASDNFYFGAKHDISNSYSQYFSGYFDEIRIWNSALTGETVLLNKNSKLRGNEAGLQAYYPFETYTKQSSGLITVTATDSNMTDNNLATGATTSTVAVPVKDVRPVEDVPFTYVASNNKIVFSIENSYFDRVEGTTLSIAVKDVRDMHDNRSNTEQWTAFVRRNPLLWDSEPVYLTMQQNENRTFTAKIANAGGTALSYTIENLPSWLSVNGMTGNLAPLSSKELTFTVYPGITVGSYETAIGLTSGNGVTEILPVQLKVTGQRPDWSVNPADFEMWMSLTGQVRIEGAPQEDPEDLIAAFVGDKCVGLASPVYEPSYQSYFVYMSVWGNSEDDQKEVSFKFWDASSGLVYPVVELSKNGSPFSLKFIGEDSQGTPDSPVLFNVRDFIEQSIAMGNGWNWISVNVENNSPALIDQFKVNASGFASQLKNGSGQFINNSGGNWAGSVASLSVTQSYLVKTTEAATLRMMGKAVQPAATPITLSAGKWSWIGYTPQFSLPVAEALAGITNPILDDQIKGQKGYRIMSSNGWIGSLSAMEPGRGYMYKSGNSLPVTFNYPSVSTLFRSGPAVQKSPAFAPHWETDYYRFANSMTLTASVFINNEEIRDGLYEIAAFSGADCRGNAIFEYIDGFEHPFMGFLMIFGDENEPISLKVYDHETGNEYVANEHFTFQADSVLGTPDKTYAVTVKSPTGLETVNGKIVLYPNPVEKQLYISHQRNSLEILTVTDISGRTLRMEKDFTGEFIDVSSFVPGVYLLKITDKEQTFVYRFIKK